MARRGISVKQTFAGYLPARGGWDKFYGYLAGEMTSLNPNTIDAVTHMGTPRDHIAKLLNHIEGGARGDARLRRYAYDSEKRYALERWARRLQPIVERKTRQVVPVARQTVSGGLGAQGRASRASCR